MDSEPIALRSLVTAIRSEGRHFVGKTSPQSSSASCSDVAPSGPAAIKMARSCLIAGLSSALPPSSNLTATFPKAITALMFTG